MRGKGGVHAREACVAGGHVWQGGMHGREGVHGRQDWGHVWWGRHAWQAGDMCGRGHA